MKLKIQKPRALLFLFIVSLCATAVPSASATAPADQIRETISKILEVLKDPAFKADDGKKGAVAAVEGTDRAAIRLC